MFCEIKISFVLLFLLCIFCVSNVSFECMYSYIHLAKFNHVDCIVQDCSNSIAMHWIYCSLALSHWCIFWCVIDWISLAEPLDISSVTTYLDAEHAECSCQYKFCLQRLTCEIPYMGNSTHFQMLKSVLAALWTLCVSNVCFQCVYSLKICNEATECIYCWVSARKT